MDAGDRVLRQTTDPDGRTVVLLRRIWERKIVLSRPELGEHLDAVVEAVSAPDHAEDDPLERRRRFYRRTAGPSR
ncbi:MAG: hypothetical protein U0R52_11795 [Solirubrobacterales bacterium]